MSSLIHFLIEHLKEDLLGPKDQFERSKRFATSRLLVPAIAIVGGESIVVAVLSTLQSVELRSAGFFFKLAANSSESFLLLTLMILIGFLASVGSNLYYSRRIKQSTERQAELEKATLRADSFNRLKEKYYESLGKNEAERAFVIASLMVKRFPEKADLDGEFLESLVALDVPKLHDLQTMLLAGNGDKKQSLES